MNPHLWVMSPANILIALSRKCYRQDSNLKAGTLATS